MLGYLSSLNWVHRFIWKVLLVTIISVVVDKIAILIDLAIIVELALWHYSSVYYLGMLVQTHAGIVVGGILRGEVVVVGGLELLIVVVVVSCVIGG